MGLGAAFGQFVVRAVRRPSKLTPVMRFGPIAVPAVAAVVLLAAGCANYTEKLVKPVPVTVVGSTTPATSTAAATTTAAGTSTAPAATTTATATTTAPATTAPAAAAGDPVAGKAVFTSAGCVACHTLAAAGATGAVGPNLDQVKPDLALVIDRVTNGKGVMPSFKGQLSAKQIADVAAFVVKATHGG